MGKNYKGGYKLIDFQKKDVTEFGGLIAKIDGIHEAIESSYGKPLLITGIVIDGVEKNDVYINELKVIDGAFEFKVYGYEITIEDEDELTATEIHVPVIKSVTSSAGSMDIDIQDGDEYLLSSTNEDGTAFNLPSECYLLTQPYIDPNSDEPSMQCCSEVSSHNGEITIVSVRSGKEIYIKRIGNIILVTTSYVL